MVTSAAEAPVTLPLMTIGSPGITSAQFALRGRVKYTDMPPGSYLEMLAVFGDEDAIFFSRTVGRRGLMKALKGDSDWRPFLLPFRIFGREERPSKLVLNATFAGSGAICVGPLELVEYDESEDMLRLPGQWWGPRVGGIVGALLGTVFGLCGAIVGFFSRKEQGGGRRIILVVSTNVIVLGTAALILTVVAFLDRQSYVVWFPLLLTGVLGAGLPLLVWFPLRHRFADAEFRLNGVSR